MPAVDAQAPAAGRRGLAGLSDELRLTLLLFLFSFFISGVPRVYTQTAAHALFIDTYGAAALPWAYLAEALCVPLAGYLYLKAEQHLSLGRLMVATLASQIVALVLFHQGVGAGVPLVAGASIVYFEIEFVLSSLLLWGLANQLMTLRQGKRLFGFVSAGEPVAIIVCGLSTPLLLRVLSPADLFLLSALGAGIGIVLVLHILRHHRPLAPVSHDADADPATAAPTRKWWQDRYVLTLVVLVAVGQMGYFFVDNAFYVEADKRFPDEHALAGFLGLYSAVMGAISLVCSVLLAPWLLRRFGVRGGLLVLPVLLLIGSLATVLVGGLGGPAEWLFWLVVGNKVIDQSFRYTLDKTTFVTLFQPLPARQRIRVQAGLEGMVEPLSGGLAGLVLFALIQGLGFGAVGITAVILCVACVWTGLVAVQYRGYLSSLRAALAGRGMTAERLSLDDPQSRQLLRQGLHSHRAGEVLYSLSLLDGIEEGLRDDEVALLLQHPAPEVRLELVQRIEGGRVGATSAQLLDALQRETEGPVREALVVALASLASLDSTQVPDVARWLDDADPHLAVGARVGLIRHGGIEGVMAAGPHLLADQQSADPQRRLRVARVMAQVGSAHFYRPLLALMDDGDASVAAAALQAAGDVAAPKLWPAMVEALARPEHQRAAAAALARVGDVVLHLLDATRARPDLSEATRLALVDVHRRLASAAGDERLVAQLDDPLRSVSQRALRALWQRRHRVGAAQVPGLRDRVLGEVDRAAAALAAWRALGQAEGGDIALLRRVLEEDVLLSVQATFFWLGLITDAFDLHEAHTHYEKGDPARRAYVIEMLDNTLDVSLKRRLLDLLEPEGVDERSQRLAPDSTSASGADLTAQLWAQATQALLSPFARAASVYVAARLGGPPAVLPTVPIQAVADDGRLMQETLAWVAAGCPEPEERPTMLTIEKMLVLRSVSLFAGVREAFLVGVAASATEVRLAAGQTLFEEGELGTSLYVIASGELEVSVGGKRVALMGERDVVGEMAALDPEPRSARVSATQDSLLLRLTDEDLDLLMSEDVEVARAIIQTLCRRLRSARA